MNAFRHFAAPVAAACIGVGILGCSSEPKAEQVPPSAQLLVQGDQMLTQVAPSDGKVYVYDASDDTLIYSGDVRKGQAISIDPDEDKVMIDSRLALEKDIHAGNRHRIYFVPAASTVERVEIRETTAGQQVPPDTTTIRREETKTVDVDPDADVTVKKETEIKSN